MAGIVSAHGALQFWKFAHHVGQQISLSQLRCSVYCLHKGIVLGLRQQLDDLLGDGTDTLGAFALGAKLVVIDHLAQTFHTRSERFFTVLVIEKFCIGQTRAHHPLVAANHG